MNIKVEQYCVNCCVHHGLTTIEMVWEMQGAYQNESGQVHYFHFLENEKKKICVQKCYSVYF